MAQRAVAARVEGDVYQGMYFWYHAAQLLRPQSHVTRVVVECDAAAGVDDVAVYFDPPIHAGGRGCSADHFQVKYHVDRSGQYGYATLCDPALTGTKRSLLQRFLAADQKLRGNSPWWRLHLVSNWSWDSTDPLGPYVREHDGALPDEFFSGGKRSQLGAVREHWRAHLEIDDAEFREFAFRLRFGVDHLGRRGFREALDDRLQSCGLVGLSAGKAQSPYDSLAQQFVMNGANEFDRATFRAMCEREGLVSGMPAERPPTIGIRSFMRFAERLEDECDRFTCVTSRFTGRHIRNDADWNADVLPVVRDFLNDPSLRARDHALLLECHGTLAFLAGYVLDRKSGARVVPVQKGVRTAIWQPSDAPDLAVVRSELTEATTCVDPGVADVAIAVSITRDVLPDVTAYVSRAGGIGAIVDVRLAAGVDARAIINADHAVAIADRIADAVRRNRASGSSRLHLFFAGPNGVMFFLGQHRAALGPVQLYEFDFEGEQGGSYSASLRLPE